MLRRNHRITALVGNYGSGKTEIALNTAFELKRAGEAHVMLADMDVINPYFRSAVHKQALSDAGIEFEQPPYALTNVDIPVLAATALRIFERKDLQVIIDVGGDDTGAAAIGQFHGYFEREGCDILYVINALRPLSACADDIVSMMGEISARIQRPIDGLINNTNLQNETTAGDILRGQEIVDEVARATGVPVWGIGAKPELIAEMPEKLRPLCFPVERMMALEWA